MPGEPLTAEWWAELDGVLSDAANMAYDNQFFALHGDCERLRAALPPVAPDGADLDAAWAELVMDALASDGRISDSDVKNAVKRHRPHIEDAARGDERLLAAARDLYRLTVGEHGHDETHSADWPSCLPAHVAMNRYRDAVAARRLRADEGGKG